MAGLFEKQIFDFVVADAGIAAQASIWAGEAPVGTARPYIVQTGVSVVEEALTLAAFDGRVQRIQFSIFVDLSPEGYQKGLEIRDLLIPRLRAMRSLFDGNRVDRVDITVGPDIRETEQYQIPVDAIPQYTRE
jgi:histone acetyltransferase (RNA polymerase elongator complex component)